MHDLAHLLSDVNVGLLFVSCACCGVCAVLQELDACVGAVWQGLPLGTLLIIATGSGDVHELLRCQVGSPPITYRTCSDSTHAALGLAFRMLMYDKYGISVLGILEASHFAKFRKLLTCMGSSGKANRYDTICATVIRGPPDRDGFTVPVIFVCMQDTACAHKP